MSQIFRPHARRGVATATIALFALLGGATEPLLAADPQIADAPSASEAPPPAAKEEHAKAERPWYSLHIQGTFTNQAHPKFRSQIPNGTQSMESGRQTAETSDLTLYAGVRIGEVEFYFNPEMEQGYGLSNTYGVAGYVSGEAYKVGQYAPYYRTPRLFGRYILGLGGEEQTVEDGPNQIAGSHDSDNITVTFGKFGVTDIFDNNTYAHDPRSDFMNWSLIDMGAFDYAAEAWGYSYGAALEWNQGPWSLRGGMFDMSREPNVKYLERGFGQYQVVTELERRYDLFANPGKIRVLYYLSSAKMGRFDEAVSFGEANGATPATSTVRHHHIKQGGGLNMEQQILPDLGSFLRLSMSDGSYESFDFTDITESVSGGFSMSGDRWGRPDDTVAIGGAVNAISKAAQRYFAAGGTGVVIGDGQLPSYAPEKLIEAYYKATVVPGVQLTADYQRATNPAYNTKRGPINFYGLRLHLAY